jgi:sulfatase maturation enzyme AslB (radical SAM superfamily)
MQKAVVFGAGYIFNASRAQLYDDYEIVAVVDNNWKHIHNEIPIQSPEILKTMNYDIVLVAAFDSAYESIGGQLKSEGITNIRRVHPPEPSPFMIDPLFFKPSLSDDEKRRLFRNNVERVSLETNSRCNRFCRICPNSALDRHSENHTMDDALFLKVLSELREIDYDCSLTLALFNEPLLDEKLEFHIRKIKEYLPKCVVYFNTNGDYLTREKWDALADAGLSSIRVTIYIDASFEREWTYEYALRRVNRKAKALGLSIGFYNPKNDRSVSAHGMDGFPFIIECANHRYRANRRAGTLEPNLPIATQTSRRDICKMIYQSFPLDHLGRVFPCVDMHPDHPDLRQYIIGDLRNETVFDVWGGEKYREFRKNSIMNPDFASCCSACSDYCDESVNNTLPYLPFRDFVRYRMHVERKGPNAA